MLWKKLKADDFETDIIEVLRESNDADAVAQMLENFDNETENGKLYVSYPMVEALRDYKTGICGEKDTCHVAVGEMKNYKNISAARSANPQFKDYDYEIWKDIIDVFAMKVSCLFGAVDTLEYERYSEMVDPYAIYSREKTKTLNETVFVLSAFPEFLVDYYGGKLWRTCARHRKNQRELQGC